ncbi:MAG: putative iron-regulated protein [Solidesulfovibrio magneticus str. Maddingley MBC34]|uniref:Putative iron-regulated protein n=1 Tax=Solidesulfovibrio magneticus str. Maddingley MBC34 TaxID=1206767 RepID=K6GBV0_9BACT|nr:MAG: putative iron-regulated protein [Solidesulfovibrio magneticus str. Maddingley MBC34]
MPVQLPFEPTAPRGAGTSRALGAFFLAGLLGLAVLGAGCVRRAPGLPSVAPESLVDATGASLAPAVFAADVAGADYLLLGEEHPNPCDHQAQAAVIRRLAKAGVLPAIGLEMVPADYQGVLDAFNAGTLPLAELPTKLDWKTTWGFDFELYAPIFEAAREYKLPVYALNAPKGLARKVGRQGLDALTPVERASLPGAILPPAPAQVEELRELFAQHGAMRKAAPQETAKPESPPKAAVAPQAQAAPEDVAAPPTAKNAAVPRAKASAKPTAPNAPPARDPFENFVTVQSLWDTQMAARALYARAVSDRPVAVVAGAGHVAGGWGIARRLAVLDPSAKVVLVVPWRGGEAPDAEAAPYFFACPAAQKSRLGMTLTQDQPTPGQPAARPLVTAVAPGSPAAKAGLLPGDAVIAAGDHPADNLSVLHKAAIEAVKNGKALTLTVSRAGETLAIDIPIALPAAK